MGEADRFKGYRRPKRKFSLGEDGNALTGLFTLNAVFFLVILTLQVVYNFMQASESAYYSEVVQWFALPATFGKFLQRPWTIITYMFSDVGREILRVISNMIWLWGFGALLQRLTGNSKLIPIYIYGGLLGGIVYLATVALMPQLKQNAANAYLLGANTGTLAIAMAVTTLAPNTRFFEHIRGGIPIWVLLIIYLVIDVAGINTQGAAVIISHIGGALAGFIFVYFLRKDRDASVWMNTAYFKFFNLFTPKPPKAVISERDKIFYKQGSRKPFIKEAIITQKRIDDILDKINQHGYGALNKEEKDILKKAAQDDNL